MTLLLFLCLAVAVVRVTRLLVLDEFPPTRAIREWFIATFATADADGNVIPDVPRWGRLAPAAHSIAYVFTCAWCMSFWVGLAVWALADWRLSVPYPWLMIALGSLLAGLISQYESQHELRWKLRDREFREGEREPRR